MIWKRIITNSDIKNVVHQLNHLEITNGFGVFNEFREKIHNIFHKKYVLLTNNGTSALYLSYQALWIKNGDEVITGTYTHHSTNSTLLHFTRNIKFCDYNKNFQISVEEIEKKITKKTKLIIIPHTWGIAADMKRIMQIKRKYHIHIIEDCSQAHFSKYWWKLVGTFGDIWVFSMQWGKLLTAWEWWFLVTNNKKLYERMLANADSGKTLENLLSKTSRYRNFFETGVWLKFRPNPIGIALANSQIDSIEEKISTRQYFMKLIAHLLEGIENIEFPYRSIQDIDINGYWMVGLYYKKDSQYDIGQILTLCERFGIGEYVYHPKNNKPSHRLPLFKKVVWSECFDTTDYLYDNCLYFTLSDDKNDEFEIRWYIEKFKNIIQSNF